MDGFGLRDDGITGDAVAQAQKPNYDRLMEKYPHSKLEACGEAVGLPKGQMGNSEVGHLNIGAGRIVYQDLTRIDKSIQEGDFFCNPTLVAACSHAKKQQKKLHVFALLSNGGVHSHIQHLFAMLELAKKQQVTQVYVHAFMDGRDVAPSSGESFMKQLTAKMTELGIGSVATVHGRYYAMDRDKRWERVQKSYRAMVYGEGPHYTDPLQAITKCYEKSVWDEFIEPSVIVNDKGKALGLVQGGDAIVFMNFRPDRAIQLSEVFTTDSFTVFDRGEQFPRHLYFVCLTVYSDTIKGHVAYSPKNLDYTLGEVLARYDKKQLRIAETEKYPHVTFFFSGGRDVELPRETRILINSPKVATYDLQPEMSAYEVADACVEQIQADRFDAIILNFANPDMVGHSGMLQPTIRAVEVTDECMGRVVDAVLAKGGVAIVTADHGNADKVVDEQGQPFTAHTTNPVPFIVTDSHVQLRDKGILADIAPTFLDIMNLPIPSQMTGKSMICKKDQII